MNHLLTSALSRRRIIERIQLRRAAQTRTVEKTTTAPRRGVVDWVIPASAFYERTGVWWPHWIASAGAGIKDVSCAAADVWTYWGRSGGRSWLAADEIWWDGEVGGEEDPGAEFAGAFSRGVVVFYVVEEVAGLVWALGWERLFAAAGVEDLIPDWDLVWWGAGIGAGGIGRYLAG